MKLETVVISGFRSIEHAMLTDVGEFNVIIGKNNAGKSNVLLAINAFFRCLSQGEPVLLNPPHSHAVDHFDGRETSPIEFTLGFRLSAEERNAIAQEIVSEAPQLKNAVEGMDPDLRLGVTLSTVSVPHRFAFVKRAILCKPEFLCKRGARSAGTDGQSATILDIGDLAANELADKAMRASTREGDVTAVREASDFSSRFDPDDWPRV